MSENKEILKETNKENPDFHNPIDKDKISEMPSLLPYSHSRGGVVIRPDDKGKIKAKSVEAMYQQTDNQMGQLYQQMQTLVEQAQKLKERQELSERIYGAEIGFEAIVGHTYHLYQRKNEQYVLSMVSPEEWGARLPFERIIAKVYLLADHTWQVMEGEYWG
jgi:hypothetical protein